jgi:hypothetical protein
MCCGTFALALAVQAFNLLDHELLLQHKVPQIFLNLESAPEGMIAHHVYFI